MLYSIHVEKVILVSTIPSNLALDAPVIEEKMKFNLIETEEKSHSDTGLGFQKNEGTKKPNVIHYTRREGHTGLNHTIKPCIGCSSD